MKALEKILEENGSNGNDFYSELQIYIAVIGGFYVGEKMSIADLTIWRLMGWIFGGALDGISQDILQSYKLICQNFQTMEKIPEIKSDQITADHVRSYMREIYKHHFCYL